MIQRFVISEGKLWGFCMDKLLSRYVCDRAVLAGKITHTSDVRPDGTMALFFAGPKGTPGPMIEVSANYVTTHQPTPGGYYVVFKDNYRTWCPAATFEDMFAHHELKEEQTADYGKA